MPKANEDPVPQSILPPNFAPLDRVATPYRSATRQDPEGAHISRTGRTLLNRLGSQILYGLLEASPFSDFSQCGVYWGVDTRSLQVAGRLVAPDVVGATPIRENRAKKTVILYLHDVLATYPTLQPYTGKWVSVGWVREGGYFVIHLGLGLDRNRTRATRSDSSQKASAPAGAQAGAQAGAPAPGADAAAFLAAAARVLASREPKPAAGPAPEPPAGENTQGPGTSR